MDSEQVIKEMREFLADLGAPVLGTVNPVTGTGLLTKIRSNGLSLGVQFHYNPGKEVVMIIVHFQDSISMEQDKFPFQVLNEFYAQMLLTHFSFFPETNHITIRTAYVLTGDKFDKKKLREYFDQVIHDAVYYYPQLKKFIAGQEAKA